MRLDHLTDLPEILKSGRRDLGLSQERLGQLVGVNQSTIHRLETGERLPSSTLLFKLLRVLNLDN